MSMRRLHCPWALLETGWAGDCLIEVDDHGRIASIETGARPDGAERLEGAVIPGMVNVHSHIHQRLIAGLSGHRGHRNDSFWTWREQMYAAIDLLDIQSLRDLAEWGFMELLEGGYTLTGEFHYPHGIGASPFETGEAVLAGADEAGMTLTLLPVWYRYGGFGRRPASERQQPFVLDLPGIVDLVGRLRARVADSGHEVGVAPHSLRAVDVADLPALLDAIDTGPVHMHIAEQPGEVEACRQHAGTTPVRLLGDHVDLDSRWCLIHATHADDEEVSLIARSGAVAGICPSTEADLGDGLFPVARFMEAGGRVAIGSDSNLVVSAPAELCLLEWGQRLTRHQRNVLCASNAHVGSSLWRHAAESGAAALGQPAGRLAPGLRADLVELDGRHELLAGLGPEAQLDTFVFAHQPGMIASVRAGGRCLVADGLHRRRRRLSGRIGQLRRKLVEGS